MYYISVNLAIGRREKIFGGTKSSWGGKKAITGHQKIASTFFFPFFNFFKVFVGARKEMLRHCLGKGETFLN